MPPLDLPNWADLGLKVAAIALVAVVAYAVVRTATRIAMRHLLERRTIEAGPELMTRQELARRITTIERLIVRVAAGVIGIIAVLMVLSLFRIDIGPAVAGLGVVGLAVGFGAQTLIRDWLAGIFVVLENQYGVGDVVRIAGVEGVVEDFSLRRTTLRDEDGTVHTVPNGQIMVAANLTRSWSRVRLAVEVAHGTDVERATEAIDRIGAELKADPEWGPRIQEPPKVVRIRALGETAVTLEVLGRVGAGEQWAVAAELRRRLLSEFPLGTVRVAASV